MNQSIETNILSAATITIAFSIDATDQPEKN